MYQPLLEGINLSHTGKGVIALIGDNGSGKSTLLKVIAGLEQQDSGEVLWDTMPAIGYLTQEITDYETLSGGQKKIARLTELLYSNQYDIVLLDEPDNHLDLKSVLALETFLKDYQGTVLLVSHDRELVKNVCNSVYTITDRRIVETPSALE